MTENFSLNENSLSVIDAILIEAIERDEFHANIRFVQSVSNQFKSLPSLYQYSTESMSNVIGKDKIKQAFLFVKRVLSDFITRSTNQKSNERVLTDIVSKMKTYVRQLKMNKEIPSDEYLKNIEVCCYDNVDFLNHLKELGTFATSLVKSSFADSAEKELSISASSIGYVVDNGNFIKVQSKQTPISMYKYFEKYTLDDLLMVTDNYIDLCQRLVVLHRCHDNISHNIDKALFKIDNVDKLLKDSKTISKKCMPAVDDINKTIGNSNVVLNGTTLVMSNVKMMNIMLTDMWTNVLTK